MEPKWCHKRSESALTKQSQNEEVSTATRHKVAPTLYVPIPTTTVPTPHNSSLVLRFLSLTGDRSVHLCPMLSNLVQSSPHLVHFCPAALFRLHSTIHKCYIHTPRMILSTPNRYRRSLEKLAIQPPSTKTSLISLLLPEIESALASGKRRREVWQCLTDDGLEISYNTFCKTMDRLRSKRSPSAARGGKSLALSKGHAKDGTSDARHDPLANLRKAEASRPGFHFRGTESLDFLVYGRREAHESKR